MINPSRYLVHSWHVLLQYIVRMYHIYISIICAPVKLLSKTPSFYTKQYMHGTMCSTMLFKLYDKATYRTYRISFAHLCFVRVFVHVC